jgi:hypothetical protein
LELELVVGSNSFAILAGAKARRRRCSWVYINKPQRRQRSKEPELRVRINRTEHYGHLDDFLISKPAILMFF